MWVKRRLVLAGLLGVSMAPLLAACDKPLNVRMRRINPQSLIRPQSRLRPGRPFLSDRPPAPEPQPAPIPKAAPKPKPAPEAKPAPEPRAAPELRRPAPEPRREPEPQPEPEKPAPEKPAAEKPAEFALHPGLSRAIQFFGGRVRHPGQYPATVPGFQAYLTASGVRHFRANELVQPYRPEIASRFGIVVLLPRRAWWQRAAALTLLGEDLRRTVDRPVWVRNWWRPPGYNEAVMGDPLGDHPTGHSMDFDYNSPVRRYAAERRLLRLFYDEPWMNLSLGLGRMTTHVGMFSPKGCRIWYYPGHPEHDGTTRTLQETGLHCRGPRPS